MDVHNKKSYKRYLIRDKNHRPRLLQCESGMMRLGGLGDGVQVIVAAECKIEKSLLIQPLE